MKDKGKKLKHRCPPLPADLVKITPAAWSGEDAAKARQMWYAWLRILANQKPQARRTS